MTTQTNIQALGLPPLQEYQLTTAVIDGLLYSVKPDVTSPEVADALKANLQIFTDIFQLDTSTAEADILAGNYHTQMQTALNNLFGIAINGVPRTSNPAISDVMTPEMASGLDQLLRTLRAAGIDPRGAITAQDVANWKSLSATSSVIVDALQWLNLVTGQANRNIQALTELVYVRTANEVMEDALTDLETALEQTKKALESLNSLQILHNNITALSRGDFEAAFKAETGISLFDAPSLDDDVRKKLLAFAKDYFGTEVEPVIRDAITSGQIGDYLSAKEQIIETIQMLRQINNIASGVPFPANTLGATLENVLRGINDSFRVASTTASALALWILDNYYTASTKSIDAVRTSVDNMGSTVVITSTNASGLQVPIMSTKLITVSKLFTINDQGLSVILQPGQIQKEITEAITSAESLNDRQKEDVRRFLFVFEEYYKSAAAVLTKVTDLITKMAQGIAR